MSIILLPFKIVFLILAFLLKGVLYILSYTIIFFSDFCGAIHYIIRLGSGIFAIGGTIVVVGWIQEGSFTGFEGGLNINNMLPVDMSLIHKIDIAIKPTDNHETIAYKQLMANQLTWCQANQDIIIKRANSLYNIITEKSEDNKYLAKRCCNFKKLEEVLDRYVEKQKSPITRNQIIRNAKAIAGQKHSPNTKDKSKSR